MNRPILVFLAAAFALAAQSAAAPRPNIVIILADDMGWSDVGCFGGEIPTPNIDALAAHGLRFTQFYNTARCSPTRAALLTGLFQHDAGMGILAEDPNIAAPKDAGYGYKRFLNRDCVTIAEALKPAGYHTYMAGKWHLGYHDQEKWPRQRGFDRYYGIISGASSYFRPRDPRGLTLDNTPLPPPEDPDYYTTDAFTDHAIQFIQEQNDDGPFFLYLAFNAPHWPLHARAEDIRKFVGKYRDGWDAIRAARWQRQLEMGLVEPEWGLSLRDDGARAWSALSPQQQTELDYRMAVYAAQVHRMDWNIGRVVDTLRSLGRLDNTLIIFLSDNGACAEPYTDLGGGLFSAINDPDASGAGGPNHPDKGSSYGTGWANASNTPFRRYKSRLFEGGISAPLVVHWPAGLKTSPGAISTAPGYLTDFMPTALEVAGAEYPTEYHGHKITPLYSSSLVPLFEGRSRTTHDWMFFEHYGDRVVRHGSWKAIMVKEQPDAWELYNLATDRTESIDLASKHPEELARLIDRWTVWAHDHHVLPKNLGTQPTN